MAAGASLPLMKAVSSNGSTGAGSSLLRRSATEIVASQIGMRWPKVTFSPAAKERLPTLIASRPFWYLNENFVQVDVSRSDLTLTDLCGGFPEG